MDCSCIRGDSGYNFYVEAIDPDTIIYQDLSVWMDENNYVLPSTYTVVIQPPGVSSTYTLEFDISSINRITKNEIGSIRDGIYCFSVDICGVKYKKTKSLFPKIECCIKQAWATLDDSWWEKLEEVENYLKLTSINAELGNIKEANNTFNIAKKLLENIKCDCNC